MDYHGQRWLMVVDRMIETSAGLTSPDTNLRLKLKNIWLEGLRDPSHVALFIDMKGDTRGRLIIKSYN